MFGDKEKMPKATTTILCNPLEIDAPGTSICARRSCATWTPDANRADYAEPR